MNKRFRIFYTDDDSDDQDFFIEVINSINDNHEVHTQSYGDELIGLLHQPPPEPDLIFLDLNMPQKSGFEVLKEIRQVPKFDQLPIIIFSTSNSSDVVKICKDMGASMYITKPTSYPELKKILTSVLNIDWKNFATSSNSFLFTAN